MAEALKPYARPLVDRVRRRRSLHLPLLSVVMPVDRGIDVVTLERSTHSVLEQTLQALELLLVVDRADAEARALCAAVTSQDRRVRVIETDRGGDPERPGACAAARNAGVQAARAPFVSFCDADDTLPPTAYARMVASLRTSGSDLVIGGVTLQEKGRHVAPRWLRLSNPERALGQTLESRSGAAANHLAGARMVRRAFWTAHGLGFDETTDYGDPVTMTAALRAATSFDVVPATVYHWHRRTDERSLVQRADRDGSRAAERVRQVCSAADLLRDRPEALAALHRSALSSVVAELVRAAMAGDASYWRLLGEQVRRLEAGIDPAAWDQIGFEDRVLAWLCAEDLRDAAAEFLMYAFDNQQGYPFEVVGGRAYVTLPVIDDLARSTRALTRVAESDHVVRARLAAVRWRTPSVLEIAGLVLVEYWTARNDHVTRLVLRDVATHEETVVATSPFDVVECQTWAARAHEDHADAGFRALVDVDALGGPGAAGRRPRRWEVLVEHEAGGRTWRTPFLGRDPGSSAGLLEPGGEDGATTPRWRPHQGLQLVRAGGRSDGRTRPVAATPSVASLTVVATELRLELGHVPARGLEVALAGPRSHTAWVPVVPLDSGTGQASVTLPLHQDDWGLGDGALPADSYDLVWRAADGSHGQLAASRSLWRQFPLRLTGDDVDVLPSTLEDGALSLRVWPREWATSRAAYDRRRLREVVYPQAREAPLSDTVLFETFAGKAGGDNPGALCAELLGRTGEDLDLVFSVIDRSVVVPEGARSVVRFSREYFELLGRARYLMVNASLPYFFRKREGQVYFQTWHGTPLKQIAHDRPHLDFFNWHHRRQLLLARDGWDYLLSQSAFCTTSLSTAFRYSGPVMEVGYPRNDVLVAPGADAVRRATRRRLGLSETARVVLYAPTWRDNQRLGMVFDKVLYLEPEKLVEQLGDCVVLVRGHYNSINAAEQVDQDRRVIDVTRYPDISHLYLASDALVTDYSSVFFDYALVDRPMVFLAPDLVAYRDENRGFYLDYHETVPGPVCETTEEVAAALLAPDAYVEVRRAFRERFAPLDDGAAAARVVDAVLEAHPYR